MYVYTRLQNFVNYDIDKINGAYAFIYIYRVIHKSLRDFRTRLRNNQDRHGRKDHINR